MTEPVRSLQQRKNDTLYRLEYDKDLWIASSSIAGLPCLVPLNFWWDKTYLVISTVVTNPTADNITKTGKVSVALGHTRDVVRIDASANPLKSENLTAERGDAWALKCGWDPRETKNYQFFELHPERIEAWRELNEHANRELMRNSEWVV